MTPKEILELHGVVETIGEYTTCEIIFSGSEYYNLTGVFTTKEQGYHQLVNILKTDLWGTIQDIV